MTLSVEVNGYQQFSDLARRLHEAARKDLGRELDKAVRSSAKIVQEAVAKHADEYMPRGYEQAFVGSLEFRTQIQKTRTHRVRVLLTARGRIGARQIRAMEEGTLRHPVYGRWRVRRGKNRGKHATRNPWVAQRIRPHFFTEPATDTAPEVRKQIEEAMHRVAEKITKG